MTPEEQKDFHFRNLITTWKPEILTMTLIIFGVNLLLMVMKFSGGFLGNSQALIADGVESMIDLLVSAIFMIGLSYSLKPPDSGHPFGHGRTEALTSCLASLIIFAAGVIVAYFSVIQIFSENNPPEFFTLPLLAVVIILKFFLYHRIRKLRSYKNSLTLSSEGRHNMLDAITSFVAFFGISLSIGGGAFWAKADEVAALLTCLFIWYNAAWILKKAVYELLDGSLPDELIDPMRETAALTEGVLEVEKCLLRQSGVHLFLEIHLKVDPDLTVEKGHQIAHIVKDSLLHNHIRLVEVVVHIEPFSTN